MCRNRLCVESICKPKKGLHHAVDVQTLDLSFVSAGRLVVVLSLLPHSLHPLQHKLHQIIPMAMVAQQERARYKYPIALVIWQSDRTYNAVSMIGNRSHRLFHPRISFHLSDILFKKNLIHQGAINHNFWRVHYSPSFKSYLRSS